MEACKHCMKGFIGRVCVRLAAGGCDRVSEDPETYGAKECSWSTCLCNKGYTMSEKRSVDLPPGLGNLAIWE